MEEPLDFTKICRVCMSSRETIVSVFKFNIFKKLMACAAIQVWPKDGLPAQICNSCSAKLYTAYKFKQQCERTDAKLRHVANISIGRKEIEHEVQECERENLEIVDSNNTSSFVFVDCDPLGDTCSGDTMTSEYNFSITEPPPLIPLVNVTEETNSIKLEDESEFCTTEDNPLEITKSPIVTSLPIEAPVISVKEVKRKLYTHISSQPRNLPNSKRTKLDSGSNLNEAHANCFNPIQNQQRGFAVQGNRHSSEGSDVCHICKKSFTDSSYLRDHMKEHNHYSILYPDERFICTVCEKTFSEVSDLKMHVRKYCPGRTEDHKKRGRTKRIPRKVFQCDLCDKQLWIEENLIFHRKQHNKETDLRCPICDKPFIKSADLKDHCVVHAQDKPFGCNKCDKRFSTQNNLNKHEKVHVK